MKACRKKEYSLQLIQLFFHRLLFIQLLSKKPNATQIEQEFKYLRSAYLTLGPSFCMKTCLLQVLFLVKQTLLDGPNSAK